MERDRGLATDQRRARLGVIGGLGGLLIALLLFKWFTAYSPYGVVDASGWESMVVGRLVLAGAAALALALAVEGLRDRLDRHRLDGRDLAHLLTVVAALGAAWVAFRLMVPPHFAEVRNGIGTSYFGSSTDDVATDAISYSRTLAVWLGLAATAGLAATGYLIARDEPGGFEIAHAWAILRDGRSGWDKLRYRHQPVAAAAPVTSAPTSPARAAEAPAQGFCEQCGAGLAPGDGFCVACGAPRGAAAPVASEGR